MKNQVKFLALSAALLAAAGVHAQSAGTWLVRGGAATVAPDVTSSCLSAPDFKGGPTGCTRSGVSSNTQLAGGVSYMLTDNIAVDVPLALPFKHNIIGEGALTGIGEIGEVRALPATVFLQYRFMDANSTFRPYVGLGGTYAYFFNPQGSARLTATTNPGGPPTSFKVDSKFILTPQIGMTIAIDSNMFVDIFYSKSKLNSRTTLSTGQYMDVDIDPASYGIAVGYKF